MSITEYGTLLQTVATIVVDFLWSPPICYFVGIGLILVTVVAMKKIMF